jgi:hypothetical protein
MREVMSKTRTTTAKPYDFSANLIGALTLATCLLGTQSRQVESNLSLDPYLPLHFVSGDHQYGAGVQLLFDFLPAYPSP